MPIPPAINGVRPAPTVHLPVSLLGQQPFSVLTLLVQHQRQTAFEVAQLVVGQMVQPLFQGMCHLAPIARSAGRDSTWSAWGMVGG